jgi:hypothetical protein
MSTELGPCFHAPRHEPETCLHDDAWRYSWIANDVLPDGTVQPMLTVVCFACHTIVSDGPWGRPLVKPPKKRSKRDAHR